MSDEKSGKSGRRTAAVDDVDAIYQALQASATARPIAEPKFKKNGKVYGITHDNLAKFTFFEDGTGRQFKQGREAETGQLKLLEIE